MASRLSRLTRVSGTLRGHMEQWSSGGGSGATSSANNVRPPGSTASTSSTNPTGSGGVGRVEFPINDDSVRRVQSTTHQFLSNQDGPYVRQLAYRVLSQAGLSIRSSERARAEALLAYVQSLGFKDDPDGRESMTDPQEAAARLLRGGDPSRWWDCDDSSNLLVAMAREAGLRAGIRWLDTDGDGQTDHQQAVLEVEGRLTVAETTMRMPLGESPGGKVKETLLI